MANAAILQIERHFRLPIPQVYLDYLAGHDEMLRDDGLLLYGLDYIIERNMTFGVQQNVSEFLAVGDDSGCALVVIRFGDDAASPFLIGSGALVPNMPLDLLRPLADSWEAWARQGFPLP